MYYYYKWSTVYVIRKQHDEDFIFGPITCEADAHFFCEMLNSGEIKFKEDETYGEEDIKDTHTVY